MSITNPYVKFGLHRGGNGEIGLISAIFQTSNTLGGHSLLKLIATLIGSYFYIKIIINKDSLSIVNYLTFYKHNKLRLSCLMNYL